MFRQRLCASVLLALSTAGWAAERDIGHLHHIHMNVSDVATTTAFYQKYLGVASIRYGDKIPALLLERSFLFMNRVESSQIQNHQLSGLTHASWGTIDGQQTFQWLKSQGVEFYTPVEALLPGSTYMYLYGPDREVVEISDASRHHRFNHVHLVATDAKRTADWFHDLLDFDTPVVSGPMRNENLSIDGVLFAIFPIGARFTPRENDGTLRNSEGTQLDHLAFSFRNLTAAYQRARKQGVQIVRPIERDPEYGFRHFFVRAPNGVLVELVEAPSWPAVAWGKSGD